MKKKQTCRFCDIINGQYTYPNIDKPFAENKKFVAVASIGALLEGWTLIIPKKHQLSMQKIYNNPFFVDLVNSLLPTLFCQYGSIVAFEHGATQDKSATACGTDHAHFHLVPTELSLLSDIFDSGMDWSRCYPSDIEHQTKGNEYLFYTELNTNSTWQNPKGYLHVLKQPYSQFFRRIIANRIGQHDKFDYKYFPFTDTAQHTRLALDNLTV